MNAELLHLAYGVQVRAQLLPEYNGILSLEALNFVKQLHERFESQRQELLENRKKEACTTKTCFNFQTKLMKYVKPIGPWLLYLLIY